MTRRNGRSNGLNSGSEFITEFTLAELHRHAKRQGYRLVPRDPQTPAHCGFVDCSCDIPDKVQIYLVRSPRLDRECLWCVRHGLQADLVVIKMRLKEFVSRVARVAGLNLVPSDDQMESRPKPRKRSRACRKFKPQTRRRSRVVY
jgi:hypothetical protein